MEAHSVSADILNAVIETARAASVVDLTTGRTFKERNLQDLFVAELTRVVSHDHERIVQENVQVTLECWPGVGRVDVAILADHMPQAFIELKCGEGNLFNCVWDVAKMAAAVAEGRTPAAYLLAAAPLSTWPGEGGSEFFETLIWTTWADVLKHHRKHWQFWETQVKTRPDLLPKAIRTTEVGREELRVGGEPWELRCAQVERRGTDWIDAKTGQSIHR